MRWLLLFLGLSATVLAQRPVVVFSGIPSIKVSEGGTERATTKTSGEGALSARIEITKVGDRYFWSSRENRELFLIDKGGAFQTYIAEDGAGYIRVVRSDWKPLVSKLGDTEARFDYVEHLVTGLRSVTYWGQRTGKVP
jgi:hypothetical protein